ncbi:MAG: OmpH family outer membrane protein, partial [Cyanobacteria bacterium]|nr:OmpH family outer membrane protein [Cyanobacteriota bacterium]
MTGEPKETEPIPPVVTATDEPTLPDSTPEDDSNGGTAPNDTVTTSTNLRADVEDSDWSRLFTRGPGNSEPVLEMSDIFTSPDLTIASANQLGAATDVVLSARQLFRQVAGEPADGDDNADDDPEEEELQFVSTDAPAAAVQVPAKPGSVDGPDGSRIEFDLAPDGKIHPKRITYGDGTSTEYTWTKDGKIAEAVTKAKDGRELVRVSSTDGEKYTIKLAGGQEFKNLKGEFTVSDDGTFSLKGKGFEWKSQSKGGVVGEYESKGKFRCEVGEDSIRTSQEVNGKYLLKLAHLKDGSNLIFTHDRTTGDVNFIFHDNGTRIVEYSKQGEEWTRKINNQETKGTLTLRDGVVPEFREKAGGDKVTEVPKPPEQRDLANAFYLQQRLNVMIDSVWANKYAEAAQELTQKMMTEEIARWKAEGKEPGPEEQRKLQDKIEEAIKKQQADMQKDLVALKKEIQSDIEKVRNAKDINEVWKECRATQTAYDMCVKWLQNQAVPNALKAVKGMS